MRSLGRSGLRWEDDRKMNLEECVDWIHLVLEGVVMNC
jgi:hypothetical protein